MVKPLSTSFALSVAALVLSGCSKSGATEDAASPDTAAKVKCLGINECRGQGQCDTATHSCAGQNECKAKGWILVPRAECDQKGGKIL